MSRFDEDRENSSPKEITVVEVRNPITHSDDKFGIMKFTDFEVCIKTTNKAFIIPQSCVRRRYSDFVWLRQWLQENSGGFANQITPSLPPKKIVRKFDDDFLAVRMKGLQKFLKRVIERNVYLSDRALHLFLQSAMSVKEIEDFLSGRGMSDATSVLPNNVLENIHLDGQTRTYEHSADDNSKPNRSTEPLLQRIVEISYDSLSQGSQEESVTGSPYSSISSSLADSFEKINIHDCMPLPSSSTAEDKWVASCSKKNNEFNEESPSSDSESLENQSSEHFVEENKILDSSFLNLNSGVHNIDNDVLPVFN